MYENALLCCHGNCGTLTLLEEITNPKIKEVVQLVSSQDDTQHRINDIKKVLPNPPGEKC